MSGLHAVSSAEGLRIGMCDTRSDHNDGTEGQEARQDGQAGREEDRQMPGLPHLQPGAYSYGRGRSGEGIHPHAGRHQGEPEADETADHFLLSAAWASVYPDQDHLDPGASEMAARSEAARPVSGDTGRIHPSSDPTHGESGAAGQAHRRSVEPGDLQGSCGSYDLLHRHQASHGPGGHR